jgi:hypothetical protein
VLFGWPTTNTGKCERRFLRRMQSLSRSSNPVLWLHKTPSHGSDVPITDSTYRIIDMLSCLGRRKPPQTHDESSLTHHLSIAHTLTRITTNSSSPVDTLEECNWIDWHAERSLSRYEGDLVPVPSIHSFSLYFHALSHWVITPLFLVCFSITVCIFQGKGASCRFLYLMAIPITMCLITPEKDPIHNMTKR